MAIGTVRGHGAVLGTLTADIFGVIRVKVQQQPTGPQYPVPLGIGPLRLRQGPGKVSAEHHVKALIREFQVLSVHLPECDSKPQMLRQSGGLFQHGGRQVDPRYPVPQLCHQDGEKARTRAHVQNVQRSVLW